MEGNNLEAIWIVLLLNLLIFFLACLIARIVWINGIGLEIPIDKKFYDVEFKKKRVFCSTSSFKVFWEFYMKIMTAFNPEYLTLNWGIDAYIYMLFQRKMMKLMLFYAVLSLIFAIPINIMTSRSGEEWFEKMTLNNKELDTLSCWVHAFLMIIFTIATIYTFYELKLEARKVYAEMQLKRSQLKDYEWLKTRTVHVRGLAPNDRKGQVLIKKLNKELELIGGKVLTIINIPDFHTILELENNKFDVEDLLKIPPSKEPFIKKWMISKKFRTKQYYQKQITELENQIDNEICKPILSSGHAFICFDTIESANHWLRKFQLDIGDGIKLACRNLKDTISDWFNREDRRNKSTFARFEDDDEGFIDESIGEGDHYIMEQAKEPMDIIWSNMSGTRGLYFWRRFGLLAICIFVVLFLSTPAVILAALKRLDILKIHEFDFETYIPLGEVMLTYLPPLLILSINQIILLL